MAGVPQKLPYTVGSRYPLALFSRRVSAASLKVSPRLSDAWVDFAVTLFLVYTATQNALEFQLFYIGD